MWDTATENSKQALEYTKLLDLVRNYCRTEQGYTSFLAEHIKPSDLKDYTDQIQDIMTSDIPLPVLSHRLAAISKKLAAARKGQRLKPVDLFAIKSWISFYRQMQTLLAETLRCNTLLTAELEFLQKTVLFPFVKDGVDSSRDPTLQSYRQGLQRIRKQRYDYAKQEMNKQVQVFRSNEPSLRNDRLTFPTVSGAKLERQTILTDSSDSQATHYVEDEVLVQLNNSVRAQAIHIEERINELCALASEAIAESSDELFSAEAALSFVDRLCAKAAYGLAINGAIIVPGSSYFRLQNARHPLLLDDFCPINIELSEEQRVLFLSGTNGGGKSITMKTLASLVLMTHQGIPIPVEAGAHIPLCTKIHCVIGDEQSIQDAHSSFTGRIERIVDICNSQGENELIILDEFGSETDPTEGGAIIAALLEYLIEHKQWVCFSSHIHGCKLFADGHPQIRCASMQYKHLYNRDYYTITYDTIGASNALETAKRFGLNATVLKRAETMLHNDEGYSSYTAYLHKKDKLAETQDFFESEIKRITEKENELVHESETLKNYFSRQLRELQQQMRHLQQKTESTITTLKKTVEEHTQNPSDRVQDSVKTLRSDLAAFERRLSSEKKKKLNTGKKIPIDRLSEGSRITTALFQEAVLVDRVAGNRKYVEILVAKKRIRVPVADILEVFDASNEEQRDAAGKHFRSTQSNSDTSSDGQVSIEQTAELDIRGKRVVDALFLLERFIQQSVENRCSELKIIHGMGTGSLRQAVHEFLREHRWIGSFRLGELREGSHGVSIAQIDYSR